MRQTANHLHSAGLFSALLLLIFVLCSLFTILIGSRVYANIYARNDEAFYTSTALGYISNKVRQADRTGCVAIRQIDGCDVLVLTSDYDGILYETWIYTKDGALRELYSEQDSGLTTDDGLEVMDCGAVSFSFREEDPARPGRTLLVVRLAGDASDTGQARGNTGREALLTLRSSQKGGYIK